MNNNTSVIAQQPANTTGIPECEPPKSKLLSDYEKWASVAVYIVIILVALIGNSLVIIIVQRFVILKI
jgi:hypothetical protein